MNADDAAELIALCDQVSEDLERFDQGGPLSVGSKFATIIEPLMVGNELIPELRRVISATDVFGLKGAIRGLQGSTTYSQGRAAHDYGHAIATIKNALQRLASTQASAPLVVPENAAPIGAAPTSDFPRIEDLLHPEIVAHAVPLFHGGHLRESVLNGVLAVFGMIKARTGLDMDGKELVGQAFGLENGRLIFSDVDSTSGRNDQKGFLLVYEGIFTGVRNVKSHSLAHDLTKEKAAQYLVMLSLLARRVEECKER
ncbi:MULTISPECIES: TIGR02391 family protein [unclassified Roseateles]|uniref:TIGR02391 family protein n=1 Tax=unclassified Roseateles TaxID=2626991 RepID=UPI0006F21703|nr:MULTISPECIES: TIGR02391 family protein [unclassified Roseateles]KQW43294.1 hypothetical protein ASC81_15990 [Pelomonas sp. Root405]KRA71032.1 hypothetical protein ASD88_14515 [Pelomonas sp. Root662]